MPLQLDATTRYATGNYTKPLTRSQLNSRSPYNTRTHVGLPPTPIDNPGLAAIQAAAHPGAHATTCTSSPSRAATARACSRRATRSSRPTPRIPARTQRAEAAARPSAAEAAVTADAPRRRSAGRWPTAARRRSRTPRSQAVGLTDWRYQLLPVPPELFAETVPALPRRRLSRRQRDDPPQGGGARAGRPIRPPARARSAPPTRSSSSPTAGSTPTTPTRRR